MDNNTTVDMSLINNGKNSTAAPPASKIFHHDSRFRQFLVSKPLEALRSKPRLHWLLLSLSILSMMIGTVVGQLLTRFYFAAGGSRKWLSTWLQTSGWPLLAVATGSIYWKRGIKLTPLTPALAATYTALGFLVALYSFMYAYGLSYLPASTSGLLSSSQLAFNAIFALIITRQKINPFGWNAIVLVTSAAVILALHSDDEKLPGVTRKEVVLGYVMTIVAAALSGFFFPITELVIRKFLTGSSRSGDAATVLLEMQTLLSLISTAVSSVAMAINHDFLAIPGESRRFKAGAARYYITLVSTAVSWQFAFLGTLGMIFLSSSLLAGVIMALEIPIGSIFAVIFFGDSFGGLKIMSMLLSLWGFVSYTYGGYMDMKNKSEP
ncbi:probable purine permease 5 isoform X2 [Selaginella moellendorffii]|uniref:probable purine permease 5 isoform X2 n=1 Tax=Selaginella moellendorffii TaxID=88036 RepID=UPI000D1D03A4|nr:probable purine permease 5 isoform X2 [Selaginella moellendorffii]|eukprot:XP_024538177.1 probable purine permease 5 isoform X2 [Selaginella moellendorffii]